MDPGGIVIWGVGRIAGITVSNPIEGMDIRLLCLLCFVYVAAPAKSRSLV
jgi:hypothetical protein